VELGQSSAAETICSAVPRRASSSRCPSLAEAPQTTQPRSVGAGVLCGFGCAAADSIPMTESPGVDRQPYCVIHGASKWGLPVIEGVLFIRSCSAWSFLLALAGN